MPMSARPKGEADPLADIKASADLVLIDAPCTGTGTWRRNPDAKWRMRPGALEVRLKDQIEVLDRAGALVKPGGRIAYITCSVLPPENGEQVRSFHRAPSGVFGACRRSRPRRAVGQGRGVCARPRCGSPEGWLMTPRRTGTDGFFVSVILRPNRLRFRPRIDVDGRVKPGHDEAREGCDAAPVA